MQTVLASQEQFVTAFRWSLVFYALPLALLLLFYHPLFVAGLSAIVLVFYLWSVREAYKAFGLLLDNYKHRTMLMATATSIYAIGYFGACSAAIPDNLGLQCLLIGLGVLSWVITAKTGLSAGMAMHEKGLKKRISSIDWESKTYDVESHSLDFSEINSAILNSYPTWKIFVVLGLLLSPGPVLAIIAGKVSSRAQYILAVPAMWGCTMLFGFMFIRLMIDYLSVKKLESERGIRLVLSTADTE